MISLKIVSIPVFDAIPDASLDDLVIYVQGFLSNYDGQNPESISSFLTSSEMNQYIGNGLGNISQASLIIHFILGALVLIIAIVAHFTIFINIVLYHGMSLFEAIKSSLYFNVVNGGYLMVVTIGLVAVSLLASVLTGIVTNAYFGLILSSFIGAYAIYLFTWIISNNTKEKK